MLSIWHHYCLIKLSILFNLIKCLLIKLNAYGPNWDLWLWLLNWGYFCDSRKIIIFRKFVVLRKKCKNGVLVIWTKKSIFVILQLELFSPFEKGVFWSFWEKGYFWNFAPKGYFGNLGKKGIFVILHQKGYFGNFDKKDIYVILHLRVKW